jgi:hypothetical protein
MEIFCHRCWYYSIHYLLVCLLFSYNPETRRLASTQGEIRVGPSHQVSCAVFRCLCEKYTDRETCLGTLPYGF